MKRISFSEMPNFYRANYLNPGDCIIQGYRIRRVPIRGVLDLINNHGEHEMDAYHYGYSANGRYVAYSHIVRIDQEREGTNRYRIIDTNQFFPEILFERLYNTLWIAPFCENHTNVKMMEEVHLTMNDILSNVEGIKAVEVDQFGQVLNRFGLGELESQSLEIIENERDYISWIELPVFSIYISELPPE
ncbi:hypothetical protein [Ekhidna sp.]|jgi:hypothetical protein|uniref:hypothetical protein n=1 Tax=Ekhidna sp. TaxID=2608089 RepID=UPI0032EC1DD2